ncbi:hypothetical protein [Streptomyces sp. NPDC088178]|uniref:hypothetical protein n=1 Tax=Streptomyces sp. NPDC088178 TaxID=3365836 RepID=UPI0038051EE9
MGSEWVSALIGAGAAVVGGIVTGWFSRAAGFRQAEAAVEAANRQVEALLETTQGSLLAASAAAKRQEQREAYLALLNAVDRSLDLNSKVTQGQLDHQTIEKMEEVTNQVRAAVTVVDVVGPDAVREAAEAIRDSSRVALYALTATGQALSVEVITDAVRAQSDSHEQLRKEISAALGFPS